MSIMAKPINFAITIDKQNEHVLNPKMTKERKTKLEIMKRRATIFEENDGK